MKLAFKLVPNLQIKDLEQEKLIHKNSDNQIFMLFLWSGDALKRIDSS